MTKQCEEGTDSKSLVAIPQHVKINCMAIVGIAQETDDGIDGNHEQNSDNVFLFARYQVMCRVSPYEV